MKIPWERFTDPCDAKAVADKILEDWDDACNELGLTHFIIFGTVLGFYRDQGYIKDDHDIDVVVASTDQQRAALMERLRKVGFTGVPPYPGKLLHRGGVVLDVWRVNEVRRLAPFAESFDTIIYNDRAYKAPHPVEEYLEDFYGKGWRIPLWKGTIVYTSGCWDLFHVGHLHYLERAKAHGGALVVGVLTDEWVASHKPGPVIPFEERCRIIEALRCVDIVVPTSGVKDISWLEKYDVKIRVVCEEYGMYEGQPEIREELEKRGVQYEMIPRTPDISTLKIMEVCCEKLATSGDRPRVAAGGLPGP